MARMCASISSGFLAQSILPSSFFMRGATDASCEFCLALFSFPFLDRSKRYKSRGPAFFANRSCRRPVVSPGRIRVATFPRMSPVSSPSFICMIVTPVRFCKSRTAAAIGEAPLYLGRSDPCTFQQPNSGSSKIGFFNICPYATTTIKSGF